MGKALVVKAEAPLLDPEIMQEVMVKGDLTKLNPQQRLSYYVTLCKSLGLNPATQPFGYYTLNNKSVLYAKKDCTDQLRKIHKISIEVKERIKDELGGVVAVTAVATDLTNGRKDEAVGAVPILKWKKKDELNQGERLGEATVTARGEELANAMMKAETKAKRRVTLSICGLGLMDETELETVPQARAEDALPADKEEEYASDMQVRYLQSKLHGEALEVMLKKFRVPSLEMLTAVQAQSIIKVLEEA